MKPQEKIEKLKEEIKDLRNNKKKFLTIVLDGVVYNREIGIAQLECKLTGYEEGLKDAREEVLERIEFIENNSDWSCETLKRELKQEIAGEKDDN